jgi:hypothetical protein
MNRTEIAGRIKGLLAKTVDNGCTESEALSAALKARELIEKHQLCLSEVELRRRALFRAGRTRQRQESSTSGQQ